MEKLLDLLQEFYWENRKFSNDDWLLTMTNWVENLSGAYAQTYIISLKGGFIKWLVENDKIDTSKANDKNLNGYEIELRIRAVKELVADSEEKTVLYLNLLMLLSISDTPIDFLCEILR